MTGAAAGECAGLSGLFIGLMSGTSIDAVDGVLVRFDESGVLAGTLAAASLAMPVELRRLLTDLQQPGADELARAALAGNRLADLYAQCVQALLAQAAVPSSEVVALGAHGQTVRHDPAQGFTIQLLNGARLAEASCIDTVADLRSADIAAGGQGAPLVPTFHARVFGSASARRAIVNIGGIANVTVLERGSAAPALGFDTGPGNTLMDAWCERHRGETFDRDGAWAAAGRVDQALLGRMLAEPYFSLPAPKSTGRDLFNPTWLDRLALDRIAPVDVQATLLELTARTIARACTEAAADEVHVCGGGAANGALMRRLAACVAGIPVGTTAAIGLAPQAVEATAFAWLARQRVAREPGNHPAVTGASGLRVLGALHAAPRVRT
ncbi:MAG: anhydro-N-acetylmuramic acid kinase [Burkholderiaceae bacterium]|nr:anhydro-N-acetylmuramic acid kinase [Burkholderiaceae bacterium]